MILTTCAACAKPIEHDASARCVGCQTRYCSDRCLRYHAHRGGHDDECEEIANKTMPAARRILGDSDEDTLRLRWTYARAFLEDPSATLDDLREAVTTLEDIDPIARRVFGGAHPLTVDIEDELEEARDALCARLP